jgi:hypothetical protein
MLLLTSEDSPLSLPEESKAEMAKKYVCLRAGP